MKESIVLKLLAIGASVKVTKLSIYNS